MVRAMTFGALMMLLSPAASASGKSTTLVTVATTPKKALESLARRLVGRTGGVHVEARAFEGLPDPSPGLEFAAFDGALDEASFRITATVEARSGGRRLARARYAFPWRVEELVVVPRRLIRSGEVIRAGDLHIMKMSVEGGGRKYALSIDTLVGRVAQSTLLVDRPVPFRLVKLPAIVKRGERVVVHALVGRMKVTMTGEALEDGALGESVKIMNPSSHQVLEGHVTGARAVEVSR